MVGNSAQALAQAKKVKVFSFSGGTVSFLHDDTLTPKLREALAGDCNIRRASNVEPNADGITWDVDLKPVGGPFVPGFKSRDEGIAFEIDWIQKHTLGSNASAAKAPVPTTT